MYHLVVFFHFKDKTISSKWNRIISGGNEKFVTTWISLEISFLIWNISSVVQMSAKELLPNTWIPIRKISIQWNLVWEGEPKSGSLTIFRISHYHYHHHDENCIRSYLAFSLQFQDHHLCGCRLHSDLLQPFSTSTGLIETSQLLMMFIRRVFQFFFISRRFSSDGYCLYYFLQLVQFYLKWNFVA